MKSISLIPPESRTVQGTVIPKNVLLLLAVVGFILVAGTAYIYSLHENINSNKSKVAMTNVSLQPLNENVDSLIVKSSINSSSVNVPALKTLIQQIAHERPLWSSIIQRIYTTASPNVQITSFNGQLPTSASSAPSTGTTPTTFDISIAGIATSQVAMVNFIQQLRHVSGIAQAVLLSSTQAQATSGKSAGVGF